MLANNKLQPPRSADTKIRESEYHLQVTAAPDAVARLQLLASSPVADLEAITTVIRDDEALTLELLRLAANVVEENNTKVSVGDLIVHLGLEQLRRMAAEVVMLPPQQFR